MITRSLRYAGSWYEADPILLDRQIDSFFESVEKSVVAPAAVQALIVPHAGYAYSGRAAAAAYHAVIDKKVERIFLLGPSHHVRFFGIGLSRVNFFETPFGSLSVDQKIMTALQKEPCFLEQEEANALEHSLEMQLPFIKKTFPNASLVPLLIGSLQGEREVREVAASIKFHLQESDLIIVTSDFTHYGPRFDFMPCAERMHEKIKELDGHAYRCLEQLDVSGLLSFYQETGVTICGLYPMAILLALLAHDIQTSLLAYYTSQDVVKNDPQHSVSYMAIAFSKSKNRGQFGNSLNLVP